MTRLLWWPLLAAAATSSCASAPSPRTTEVEEPDVAWSERRSPAPLLWRVSSPKGPTSYVFGTIHVGVRADELAPSVWRALADSSVFAMEADVEAAAQVEAEGAQRPWADALDPAGRASLERLVGPARAERLAQDSPGNAYAAVLQALYPARASMDVELARVARRRGAELRFLEDWQFQLALGSRHFDADELIELLAPNSHALRQLDAMIEAYRRGDLRQLERMALPTDEVEAEPARFDELFFQRNHRWAESLENWLSRSACFVAVGVGHLPGERGLLRLLEKRGFRVERVANPER